MPDVDNGMMGALAQLAYGSQGSPFSQVAPILEHIVPQQDVQANEWLGFGAGMGAPTRTGALTEAMSAGMEGQGKARMESMKLRAAYLPLIMDAITKNQQMTLAAANASRDWLKDVMPKVDNHLASLRTNDQQPSYPQVAGRLLQLADEYQLPPQLVLAKLKSIPQDTSQLNQYLDQLAIGTAGADKLVPTITNNAAGQPTAASPARGTIRPLGVTGPAALQGEGAPGNAAPLGANPTKDYVDFYTATRGDVKEYENALRDRAEAYRNMIARINEQSEWVKQFQPGRYSPQLGGLAAAVKDIGSRLPNIEPEVVKDLANKLLGAKPGSDEAVAAQQVFEQLAQQETMAQLKSALGPNQRLNMMEYSNFSKNNLGKAMDPETFKALRNFYMNEAANAINQYSAWGKYVSDPGVQRHTVTDFDSRWKSDEFDKLLKGRRGVITPGVSPSLDNPEPSPAPKPAPAQDKPAPSAPKVDLSEYEPGAKVGPTGKVYVVEKGVPRLAVKKNSSNFNIKLTPTRSTP